MNNPQPGQVVLAQCQRLCCLSEEDIARLLTSNIPVQVRALKQGIDVLVATPGRLEDLVQDKACRLAGITYLVLDEADRMLDLGFEPHIRYAREHSGLS